MHSTRQPAPSSDAVAEVAPAETASRERASLPPVHPPLGPLIDLFSGHRIFGVVWFDTTLTTMARFGALADFIPIGVPIGIAAPPLFGLDDRIIALRATPGGVVEVPNVSVHTTELSTPKLNFNVYWMPTEASYVMLVSRVLSRTDLELELSNQARARSIAEAMLVEKSREIERANRDLSEFAYVISHDLNAPLRHLRHSVEALGATLSVGSPAGAEPAAAPLVPPGDAASLLAEIRELTVRMSSMLTGLLSYSRIGRKREAVDLVDTRALIEAIVRTMPHADGRGGAATGTGHGVAVSIEGDWPTVPTLATPLDVVLRNLVDNAMKHHDRPSGSVRVRCEQTGADRLAIAVVDDGPGIPYEYHTAVFRPFIKLAGTSGGDAASSGIGLSLVKRTVEAVGGQLTISSGAPERRGTAFHIEWPIIEPDATLDSVVHVAPDAGGR